MPDRDLHELLDGGEAAWLTLSGPRNAMRWRTREKAEADNARDGWGPLPRRADQAEQAGAL